jgi:hypothetical protein
MQEKLRFWGLDVHAEMIAVAIAEPDSEVRSLVTIKNRTNSLRKLLKKLGLAESCGPVMGSARLRRSARAVLLPWRLRG